jgi:hypothetical protein
MVFMMIADMPYEIMPAANASNVLKGLATKMMFVGEASFKIFSDGDLSVISKTGMNNYQGHYPAGASSKSVLHFGQMIRAGRFMEWDYGPEENMKRYGHKEARDYDLTAINNQVAMYCGSEDLLSSTENYNWTREKLQEGKVLASFKEYPIGHCAFLMPNDRGLFKDLVDMIEHENKEGD